MRLRDFAEHLKELAEHPSISARRVGKRKGAESLIWTQPLGFGWCGPCQKWRAACASCLLHKHLLSLAVANDDVEALDEL